MRVDESTKGIVQELSGAVSDRIHSDVSRIDSNLQGIRDSLTKLESIKSIIRKLDDISDVLESDSGDASKTVFLDALTSLRELITKESERYTGLLSSESEMVKSVQEQSARIAEKAETIESRVTEPITRIESMLTAVKASTDELVAPTDDPDKKSAVVSDITSAKAAILDLISGTALSNKSSIEALPEAVSFLRGLLEKESEKTDVIGSRVGEPIARIESQLSSEFEMVKSVQEQSARIAEKAETIESRVTEPITRIESMLTAVKASTDELVAPSDDPDKKSAVVSDITSAKAAILDLISDTALSNKSSIEALPDAISVLRGLLEKESEKTDVISTRVGEPIARIESQLSSEYEMVKSVQEQSLRIENSLTTIKSQSNSILEKLAELKTALDSIHDRTKEIVVFEQEILPKLKCQLDGLSAQQEESRKMQLRLLYRAIPFWKSKERKDIKKLL